jgi:hypothetical protein
MRVRGERQTKTEEKIEGKIGKTLPVICFNWKIFVSHSRILATLVSLCKQTFLTWMILPFSLSHIDFSVIILLVNLEQTIATNDSKNE